MDDGFRKLRKILLFLKKKKQKDFYLFGFGVQFWRIAQSMAANSDQG
jgi:hypothetical protein